MPALAPAPRSPEPRPRTEPPAATDPAALLPPVLTGPASFLWLWTLPIALLAGLDLQSYHLVGEILEPAGKRAALLLGFTLLGSLLLSVALFFAARRRVRLAGPQSLSGPRWALPGILVHAGFLWLAALFSSELLPRNVSAWIYPEGRYFFHQFAFAMVPLFHGILRLAGGGRVANERRSIATNLGVALGVPFVAYLGLHLANGLHRHEGLAITLVATLLIAGGVLMFVCLVRGLLLLLRAAARGGPLGERVAILVLALGLPLGGLAINRSIPFPADYQAPEVYALTVLNAALLLLASILVRRRPTAALPLLALTFPFALYFFVVFLPYLPLAVIAVVALGAGFLMLAPTLLFALHLHLLWRAARLASDAGLRPSRLAAIVACGLAFLPAAFVTRSLGDRLALNAALDHAFSPAVSAEGLVFDGDHAHVRRALAAHRSFKDGRYLPLISDAYASLVFDGLVLPDDKLAALETLFSGQAGGVAAGHRRDLFGHRGNRRTLPRAVPPPRRVEVAELAVSARPVDADTSSVTLALALRNPDPIQGEFVQRLPLPPGVLVHGFRLHVNGEPVPGRLVEKKTALWVYTMIRDTERRDPGLLFHTAPDELELRVYPVLHDTPSRVEIDFLVPAAAGSFSPAAQGLDPAATVAALGPAVRPRLARAAPDAIVAAGLDRASLPAAPRPAYVHLLVDRSAENAFPGDLAAALPPLRERFPEVRAFRVSAINLDVLPLAAELTPPASLAAIDAARLRRALPARGGFNLDAALAHALRLHRDADLENHPAAEPPPARPIFVILGAKARPRPSLRLPLAEAWADLTPGLELHELGADGSFQTHLAGPPPAPLLRLGASLRPLLPGRLPRFSAAADAATPPLLAWHASTSDDGQWRPVDSLASSSAAAADTPWTAGLALHLREQDRARDPGGDGAESLAALLADTRRANVLTASSSFIVVENAAQWRALEAAEARKLDQHEALEHLEAPAPSALLVLAGFVFVRCARRRALRVSPALPA